MGKSTERAQGQSERVIKKLRENWVKEIDEKALEETADIVNKKSEEWFKTQKESLSALGKQFSQGFVTGTDGAGGAISAASSVLSNITSKFPVQGVVGMMLFGKMREEEIRSNVEKIAQMTEQAGSRGINAVRGLQGQLRALENEIPGISEAFAGTISSLSSVGFTGEEMMQKTGNSIKGVRDSVVSLGTALDRTFEQAAGTAGKFAASLAVDTNGSLRETMNIVRDMGLAVRDTGLSFQQMQGAIMQVTGAMRLQLNSQEESLAVLEQIQDAQAGFEAQGMSAQRAGQLATAGVSGAAQALTGISEGLKAVMGQRMSGGDAQGLDAIMQFETGFRGGDLEGEFFQTSMEEVLKMSSEISGGERSAQYKVLKDMFGMNAEQAQAMLAIQRSTEEGGDIQKAAEEHMDQLNNAFRNEALKTNTFTRLMNNLIDAVAKIGAGLADILVNGFELLGAYLQYFTDWISGVDISSEGYNTAFKEYTDDAFNNLKGGAYQIAEGVTQITKTAGRAMDFAFNDSAKKRQEYQEARVDAPLTNYGKWLGGRPRAQVKPEVSWEEPVIENRTKRRQKIIIEDERGSTIEKRSS